MEVGQQRESREGQGRCGILERGWGRLRLGHSIL